MSDLSDKIRSLSAFLKEEYQYREDQIDFATLESAASELEMGDETLYLPVPFVLKQQQEYEAKILDLERQLMAKFSNILHTDPYEKMHGETPFNQNQNERR